MNILSERIYRLAESETLAMTRRSRELKEQGFDVINLSIGQPDFNTPDYIKQAAREALDQNFTFYPPVNGYLDLRKAICQKLKRDNNLDYTPDQVVVSTGAKQALANTMLSLVNPGDEVIVPAPYWVSYREIVKLAEGTSVVIKTGVETDFKVTPDQLEKAISPKTKVFIFSSPCNPTGSVYTREELAALAAVFQAHPGIFIISDEIYELINFKGSHESIAQFPELKDRVIIINGVSKGFAMTGWRLGYCVAAPEIAKACDKIQGQFTSGASSISQRAAIAAIITNPAESEELKNMIETFRNRRDLFLKLLDEIPGFRTNVPDGAFYIFPDVTWYYGKSNGSVKINNGTDLCNYLLDHAHVALVSGEAFGNPDCIRLSYATSNKELTEAARRIKESLALLH
ncbi:pyridoxal phosphate-dependent aminotransferase [Lentimicrobium sp.]|jgi:aspartate aminotransferase|uniref:pyridoxal phosphate-dependent aminotransferase n=1 Tax=Lentimicrobium sp. TaxID=2034841 RepID=UPI0025D869BA|nr:pyridoxal phosphate-dependent aminotransferase [Lentimicrobium sp.]MCO5258198.1 pyridoxal phosphate-dependent aminotransferase [Lentimicrobium sp.]MCO5262531.1 pyridoxal phosphate-dependent aminotransferase [Lentimicrobium sp.]HPF64837.1 pyridoxal phosphate-dependent aminotransferase [Lentimicrobium sp.]HPR26140.1 pyridoxal phosphate-dependent aminotransferase [Lentimicrobium sp.]HRW68436.1 pyridoxal phosphate-dependent aminotransferase [Lentimicrobium sp.]